MAKRYPVNWVRNYDRTRGEAYNRKLEQFMEEMSPEDILLIPGVYELLSAELDSDIMSALGDEKYDRDNR